jgi:hypothetical protein
MSNQLAIAAVTATFQRVLQSAIQDDVYGARVTTVRPNTLESGATETGINIFLYLVTPNPVFQSPDPVARRPRGDLVKRSQVAFDLQYLLSFHGNEVELEPQRLYGSTVRLLQDCLTLTVDRIRETLADPTLAFLAEADLTEQMEPVRIVPTEISVENLSKIWSVFFQTPYSLSCTYKGSVVLIDSAESGQRALPVRDRRPLAVPFQRIVVERIQAEAGSIQPILANSRIIIMGRSLAGTSTLVRIAGIEITPETVTDTRIVVSLASMPRNSLRAGAQGLQVVHPIQPAEPASAYRGVESNLAAFVLRPTIVAVNLSGIASRASGSYSAEVTVQFDVIVGATQLVVLILNPRSPNESSRSYLFKARIRHADSDTVAIAAEHLEAGEYLVRVQIDGAESLLTYDTDPNSPSFNQYNSPTITIR